MKITERLQGLYAPDRPNQQETKVHKPKLAGKEIKFLQDKNNQKPDIKDFSLKQILSVKEVNSLHALFGYEQNGGDGIYGANKMSNVHSGMLLDVKG
ncbi:MAG: hypothetical protein D8M58_01275 [Calditrichaeota bacterium]|nr:MAG: hypothetical protein DWQ03_05805 [Calditrichota bacterium]MBL1204000.1 hypothetical protein [Calditrichota bacterium]NOG43831.1 hypothetical protein [Calditrichota bacterium]